MEKGTLLKREKDMPIDKKHLTKDQIDQALIRAITAVQFYGEQMSPAAFPDKNLHLRVDNAVPVIDVLEALLLDNQS